MVVAKHVLLDGLGDHVERIDLGLSVDLLDVSPEFAQLDEVLLLALVWVLQSLD